MKQTVFITGASSGLGKEAATLFPAKGWNVIATMGKVIIINLDIPRIYCNFN